jgi:Tol biopolymer transport system component
MFDPASAVRTPVRLATALLAMVAALWTPPRVGAQPPAATSAQPAARPNSSPGLVTLDRLFDSGDFATEPLGRPRWLADGTGYTKLEAPAGSAAGRDLVRYDAATGARTVLVAAARLVPPGEGAPLAVEDYAWSPDGRRLLVFANSQRVWRQNTRGDYWLVELAGGAPRRLGGDAPGSSLMFAKFSPDGQRVAYVRQNDLYVEDVPTGRITRLTSDGSRTTINGTFDWVYEEELNLRDGFRWSPDSRRLAYWQLDASGVRDFLLVNNTDSLYSRVVPVQFPKAGTTNSAGRVGVVDATGGPTRWLAVPGDPRNHYIARMDWAASSDEVVLQQLNRRQNANAVMLGDARTGRVRTVLTERDSAWVDVVDDLRWIDGGRRFTWVSERDGWRHLYVVSRDGERTRLVTPGAFDLHNPGSAYGAPLVVGTDSSGGWIYFTASPDDPTQLYLYRARLDGRGGAQRVTPAGQRGTHAYTIAPGARWAFHTHSSIDTPPVTELVRLPDHRVVRTLAANAGVKGRRGVAASPTHGVLPRRGGARRDAGRVDDHAARLRFDQALSDPVPRLRRAGGADGARRLGWGDVPLARHAGAAGLRGGQSRQPGHAGAARARLAQGDPWSRRRPELRRPGSRRDRAAAASPVPGQHARRRLGMERRRLHDAQPALPLARAISHGDVDRARRRPALLRHDLPGAVHGAPAGRSGGIPAGIAGHLRRTPARRPAAGARHRRRQRALPERGGGRERARRGGQAVHDDGLPQPLALHLRGRRHVAAPVRAADAVPARAAARRRRAAEAAEPP